MSNLSVDNSTIIHEEIEPGVINAEMIVKSVLEDCPKGESGRLIAEAGIILEDIKELRLEFLNILRIDHMWMLDSLVVLHISNNMIEKIENLERLVNLKELDLSFNNIEVIENLETLVNLEVLTVFGNKISKLENLDNLKKLLIFSAGNNMLVSLDNVRYLRAFEQLRALNLSGNPLAHTDSFLEYVYAFLPQLVYYEYRMITQTEREMANLKFKDDIKELVEKEAKTKKVFVDESQLKLHFDAFVEYMDTDDLFLSMFKEDAEGILFAKLNEESEEVFIDYQDKFMAHCHEIFDFGLAQYNAREAEIEQYNTCMQDAKDLIMKSSRDKMNEFIEKKSEIFLEMRTIVAMMQMEAEAEDDAEDHFTQNSERLKELATQFQERSHKLWQDLMRMEMTLYEQVEDASSNFEVTLREMQSAFVEGTQAMFVKLRDEENAYFEQISDVAVKFLNSLDLIDDASLSMDPGLFNVMVDRDTLASSLAGSHEIHVQVIDDRQDALTTRANKWADQYFEDLRAEDVRRNRAKIVEISHFMDLQQEEYDKILSSTGLHFDDMGHNVGSDDFDRGLRVSREDALALAGMLDESESGEEEETDEEEEEGEEGAKSGGFEEEEEEEAEEEQEEEQEEEEKEGAGDSGDESEGKDEEAEGEEDVGGEASSEEHAGDKESEKGEMNPPEETNPVTEEHKDDGEKEKAEEL